MDYNNVLITENQRVIEIDCDSDVQVPDDGTTYHASDVVYVAGLKRAKKREEANLKPGKYNVRMTVVITEME